jgi:hypothetical protein
MHTNGWRETSTLRDPSSGEGDISYSQNLWRDDHGHGLLEGGQIAHLGLPDLQSAQQKTTFFKIRGNRIKFGDEKLHEVCNAHMHVAKVKS